MKTRIELSDKIEAYDMFYVDGLKMCGEPVTVHWQRIACDREDFRNHPSRHEVVVTLASGDKEALPLPCWPDELTRPQLKKLLDAFAPKAGLLTCTCCGKPKWPRNTGRMTRLEELWHDGLCVPCYLNQLDAEAKTKAAMNRAKYKAKGYTHVTEAWVHPARGDDYMISMYTKGEPTARDLAAALRGSRVKNDYHTRLL